MEENIKKIHKRSIQCKNPKPHKKNLSDREEAVGILRRVIDKDTLKEHYIDKAIKSNEVLEVPLQAIGISNELIKVYKTNKNSHCIVGSDAMALIAGMQKDPGKIIIVDTIAQKTQAVRLVLNMAVSFDDYMLWKAFIEKHFPKAYKAIESHITPEAFNRLLDNIFSAKIVFAHGDLTKVDAYRPIKNYLDIETGHSSIGFIYTSDQENDISRRVLPQDRPSALERFQMNLKALMQNDTVIIQLNENNEVDLYRLKMDFQEEYIQGYNLSKVLSQEIHRLIEKGEIQKGEMPVLLDMEESFSAVWKVPFINRGSLDEAPRYLTTEKEIFSQMKSFLKEQAHHISSYYKEDLGDLSLRGDVDGEAVDGLNSAFLAQAIFNWVRHGFGPELESETREDLSTILKAQFYVQVSMLAHGALSDAKNVVDNVKLLLQEGALAGEAFESFKASLFSSANSALGLGLGGAMVVLDALELSKLDDPNARMIITTQLAFDSLNLAVGAGSLISGIIASKAAEGSALAEVAATSSASLGYLAVPLTGIGIGVMSLVQLAQKNIEKTKAVCRMVKELKKELEEGYLYDQNMQSFIAPSLVGINKLTLTNKGISTQFAEQRYRRFRSGWHNRELISGGSQAYGSFLKTFDLPYTLEKEKSIDQGAGTLVMPYIPSKDYNFSLGAVAFSYFRHDAEFAILEELEGRDPGFHFKVFFMDHIITNYNINYKDTDVELVVKEGPWNLVFPWVYDQKSEGAKERKDYIKNNAKHIRYRIHAEPSAKAISVVLPPFEFPLTLSLSQEEKAEIKWIFDLSHLDQDLSVYLEGNTLHIGRFKVSVSRISKDQMLFRRKTEEFLQEGKLIFNKEITWRDVEIIAYGEDLQDLKNKLHTQISLHQGHEDYLKVEGAGKDQAIYYDVGRNRYIKSSFSYQIESKILYAKEALLLNVEGEHAYFYCPWDGYSLSAKAQEKLPLLFWAVDIDGGSIIYKDTISFSCTEDLSKCIEVSPTEGIELRTKLYKGMGTTFLEELYESKVSKKGLKLLWQLTKGQKEGDLDLYLYSIEGTSKEISMESFDHLANQVMIRSDKGEVKWWMRKEKQFINALSASASGAYPVPLSIVKNTQGERVCFWLLHQKEHLFDLIYQVKDQEKSRLKNIKLVSQASEHLIVISQEGIIYQVDSDLKCTIIGLDESFLKSIKPSGLKAFLDKKSYTPVLSLKTYQDALSRRVMGWYDVKEDRYYVVHYEGLPTINYKGTTGQGLGLIYDQDKKELYTLEGIKAMDLDQHYSLNAQGAAMLNVVSKQKKLISGVKSVLSDGRSFLQIEYQEGSLLGCDIKTSLRKWYLQSFHQDSLKGEINSGSLSEKIQKAKDSFSREKGLTLKIPAFISLGEIGFYAKVAQKLLLINLEGKQLEDLEVLGIDGDYGYVNLDDKLYQIPLKDSWQSTWPERKILAEGKLKRIDASLILLEVQLGSISLTV